ncbi:MAG: ankyrin repeat domain-containing protein, partial [Wolbachia sp.]
AGLAFTAFLVGKHIANGDIEGLGYDALNLWVMPKIGEKISGKILELGTKLDSQMLRGFAPAMGRAIGNFAAFLGLAESIKARQSATDPADIKIADLNIATNSIFIAADVPAVVTETMSAIGVEAGIVGEFAGPVGAAISVAVIIIAQFVEAKLEVEKLEGRINLTDQEKHDFYWDFFLSKQIPHYIQDDIEAKEIYQQYISKILEQFKGDYDKIAISLPYILTTEEEYSNRNYIRKKRQYETQERAYELQEGTFKLLREVDVSVPNSVCRFETKIVNIKFSFELSTNITYPFYISGVNHYSRMIPSTTGDYVIACGPRDDNIRREEIALNAFTKIPSVSCNPKMVLNRRLIKWSFQGYPVSCYDAILYSKSSSSRLPANMLFYIPNNDAFISVTSNYTIDVIFNGTNISLASDGTNNQGLNTQNRYHFTNQLNNCKVYKKGVNFFYITKDEFSCNLGGSSAGQSNTVITRGNFKDSENIHSVIGSNEANHIEISHAGYVDGKGGNDVITAKNFTTIKGYFGDSIYGKGLVLLPINLSDIGNITHANNITTIYNKSGAFISIDKQMLVKTADGSFVTPTKVDDKTGVVTNLHVTKSISGDVVLDNLRKIDNSSFNITKQLSSANYHSTISSSSNHIFYPDKEHHSFYWEAPSNISHLYLFDNKNANITIAQANGILDFSQLNCTLDDIPFTENNAGEIKINKNGLHVTLLPDYKDVTVTFDGQEYYKLQNGELERDYCSHSLRIDGRFSVNGTDLLNHHNCFTFDSDKVLFLKLNNDLLLLSDRGALSISDYYSYVNKNWDLSIELNNRIMEPEEFGERADGFSSFRYYKPDEQGLQIYHNQPINKNDIGLVDLKGKSILDFDMKVMNDTLLLSHKSNTLVKVENWNTYQPAREMMFGFNDATVSNSKCIASTCNSEDVVVDFNKEKIILQISNAIKQNNINAKDKDGKTLFHIVVNKGDLSSAKLLVGKIESMSFEESLYAESDKLVKAVRQRERLRFLINEKDNLGYTPLQYAAKDGKWDIVNLFLDKTAERNQDDVADKNKFSTSWTTMHYAVYNGNMDLLNDIFQFLSDKETIINTKDNSDWAPLHYAVYYNALDVVKFLVDKGADISAKDKDGKIPLDLATQENDTSIEEFLKQTQLDLDKQLLTAVQDCNLSKAEVLVGRGANINTKNDDGYTSLHFAVLKNFQSGIDYLIKKGANIDAKDNIGRAPLHWAARDGYLSIVQTITEGGANLDVKDKDNKTPSDLASWKGYDNIVQYLKQVQLDKRLLAAIKGNDCREVQNLVSQGANLEAKDRNGRTSLYWASCNGYLGVVQCLIDMRVNLEVRDNNGDTPLHCAAWSGQLDIVKSLVDSRRVGVNIKNDDGWTPLHWASRAGYLDVVQYLVNNRASVDARDKDGTTPLGIARAVGRSNIVEYLEKKLNKEREKPAQRKRRHHHGDHSRHHLSRKPLAIDSSNQPEIAASSGTRPSSWVNIVANTIVDAIKGISRFVYSPLKVELPEIPENGSDHSDTVRNPTKQYTSQFSSEVCMSNNIGLMFFLLQSFLDEKYPLPKFCSITPEEALANTLNIVEEFEKTLEKTAKQSGVLVKDVNFFKVYLDIAGHVRNERYCQIPNTLYSVAKEVCPKNEKFLSNLKGNIEKMCGEQQVVNSGYQPNDIADNKPRSYLNNTTVDKQLQGSYHAISS